MISMQNETTLGCLMEGGQSICPMMLKLVTLLDLVDWVNPKETLQRDNGHIPVKMLEMD